MRIIYVYDALCGWCYGFSPVINRLHLNYKSFLDIEVISGGMILGKSAGPIGHVASYISNSHRMIEEKTGVTFGSHFLDHTLSDGKVIFDSFPPSKALKVFKELNQDKALDFAAAIQSAIYFDGSDPSEKSLYVKLATDFGVSRSDFEILWSSPDYDVRTREEFIFARQLNVSAYPTVFIEVESTYHVIARGYTSYRVIRDRLEHLAGFVEPR